MMQDVTELSDMLYEPGADCEFGWYADVDEKLFDAIRSHTNKPYCLIKNWCWWDMDVSEETQQQLAARDMLPAIVYSHCVVNDQLKRYQPNNSCRSSLLTRFTAPAFFETANSVYVLIGKGTRKTVDPQLAARIFF